MRIMARLALLATPALVAACTCCLAPAPSAPLSTPSTACAEAWVRSLARPSDSAAVEAPMRACRSLDDFYYGAQAARGGDLGDTNPKLIAEGLCATDRFNDTPICGQLGITPPPATPTPGPT